MQLSSPSLGSADLYFPTRFSQNGWGQLKSCLWKQHLAYWRSPAYNLNYAYHAYACNSFNFWGALLGQGKKIVSFNMSKISTTFTECSLHFKSL